MPAHAGKTRCRKLGIGAPPWELAGQSRMRLRRRLKIFRLLRHVPPVAEFLIHASVLGEE